ncbi:MAG: hypothetical protein JWO02_2344 [Solirubrobacterales bacterium]|nr:hypothetical protein [Solirubrobacterales bacterium]
MSHRRLLFPAALAAVVLAVVGFAVLLTGGHGDAGGATFSANGCQKGYLRLSDEYVRELRAGSGGQERQGASGGEAEREREAQREREAKGGRATGELIPADVRVEGKGFCLKEGVRKPEPFNDLTRANTSVTSRLGFDRPGQYAAAARQKTQVARTGRDIAGTAGTWKPVGDGHVIFDDPAYTNTNGLAGGLSRASGRIADYAYDAAGERLFAAVAQGGVWTSTDDGKSWTSIGDNLPTQIVGAVAWTPAAGGTLVALTGDNAFGGNTYGGQGIFWSTDLGKTWKKAKGAPDGAQGFRVVTQDDRPDTLYAATGFGLYRSTNAGRSWTDVVLPTGDCAGKTTTRKGCFLANVVTDVQVRSADTFGHDGGAVAASVGWRAGRKQNTDGSVQAPSNGMYLSGTGAPGSFSKVPDSAGFTPSARVGRVSLGSAYGPHQNHNYLYAVVQDSELFNSGRIEGLDVPPVIDPILGTDLTATPTYLEGVYVSKDFGRSWTRMAKGEQFLLPTNNSTLAALVVLGFGPGIQSWYNSWIQPDPYSQRNGVPTRLDLGLEEVYESRTVGLPQDGLTDFTTVAPYANTGAATAACILTVTAQVCQALSPVFGSTVHPDQHGSIFLPTSPTSTLVIGNDGGSYAQQVPATGNLTAKGFGKGDVTGFNTLLPYSAAVAKDGTVYAGLQDNGTVKIDPKTGDTIEVYGGDGTYALVDPDDSGQALVAPAGGDLAVTHDGGRTNETVVPDTAKNKQFLTPFVFDATSTKRIMYAARNVFLAESPISSLTATSFKEVYDLGTAKHPGVATAAEADDDPANVASAIALRDKVAYVGYCGSCDPVKENKRFKAGLATNVGGTWHIAAVKGLAQRQINALTIDPDDPKTVYVALGQSTARPFVPGQALGDDGVDPNGGHLYKSTDGGESFTDISGDLPDIGATSLLVRGKQLIAGTTVGVFASEDRTGKRWGLLGDHLPAAPVSSLQLDPGDPGQLVAASFGRGVYRYAFKNPAASSACVDHTAPVSRFSRRLTKGRAGRRLVLRGTASDRGCGTQQHGRVRRVTISIAKATGKRCRYLKADGRFAAAPTSCARTRYVLARGFRKSAAKGAWSFTTKRPLPRGRYKIWIRGTDAHGNVEHKQGRRNGLQVDLR